ncbi:ABC transporter ATP-binding protein [Brevibacillus fluminis]|uniref:ABC transporter ATP-binding protein n=1 Tax=Brevibacillus fluminis TaxID=511487 RepID=UPI003F89A1CD
MTTILQVERLRKEFRKKSGLLDKWFKHSGTVLYAVDGVTFSLEAGETLGLVGESGCGKSTVSRTLMRLYEPTDGTITFLGQDITRSDEKALRKVRKNMQMVFQDPYSSLNPRMTVREMLAETIRFHQLCSNEQEQNEYIDFLLERVGLHAKDADKYPKAFSGGQRQRIGIARAIAVKPKLLIADEPVSALDVSVQAHILNLLEELKKEFALSLIFISHDLSVVKYISDRVAVMYLGRIVEIGTTEEIFRRPAHPYTQALLSAVPRLDQIRQESIGLAGDPPSPYMQHAGCPFVTRCPKRMQRCETESPPVYEAGETHRVSCHLMADQGCQPSFS